MTMHRGAVKGSADSQRPLSSSPWTCGSGPGLNTPEDGFYR